MSLSPDLARKLIDLRHGGATWEACAQELERSSASLRSTACRLRDSKRWKLANGSPARGAPKAGKRGRPRNKVRSLPVSLRFAPDVAQALRTVQFCTGADEGSRQRLGEVVTAAVIRATKKAKGQRVSRNPLGLAPGRPVELRDGHRTETISVNVPKPQVDELVALSEDDRVMSVVAEAVHQLLDDLNYRRVDCEAA